MATGRANTASESTGSTGYALSGPRQDPKGWKQLIIIRRGAVMIRVPTNREPTHPGMMLVEEFLKPFSLSQRDLADGIHVPYQRVNELVNGRRGVTPATALRLGKFFGNSAAFWMNLQLRWDLYHAQRAEERELDKIHMVRSTG